MKKIVVIGSLNMDIVVETSTMPQKGETISGKSISYVPGGKGANQAAAIGKLGGQVVMIGAVGADASGQALTKSLEEAGVDSSGIEVLPGLPTGQAFITVDQNGDNSIIIIAGANGKVSIEMVEQHRKQIEEADMILMQLEIPTETVCHVKNMAKQLGKLVIIDPAPAVSGLPEDFWKGVDYIKPNETEIEILTGRKCSTQEEVILAARSLIDEGVSNVIVSLGSRGCLWVTGQIAELFTAERVDAVDTTAAGDCFIGAFVEALSEARSVQKAIAFAQKAAACSVMHKGAQASLPLRKDLEKSIFCRKSKF